MMVGVTLRKDPICMQTSTFALCEHVSQFDRRLNFCRNSGQNSKNFGRHSQKYQRYILKQYITVIPGISFHMLNSVLFLHVVWNSFHNKKWSIHKIKINRICYFDNLLHGISFWKHCCMVFLLHFAVSLAACLITQKCTNVNLKRKGPEDYFAPSPMCPIFSSSSTIFCAQDNHFWYCCC